MDDDIFFEGVPDPLKSIGAIDLSQTPAEKGKDASKDNEKVKEKEVEKVKEKEKDVSVAKVAAAATATDASAVSTDKCKDTSKDKEKEKKKDVSVANVVATAAAPAADASAVSADKSKDTSKDKVKEKEVDKVKVEVKGKEVEKVKDKEKEASKIAAAAVPVTDVSAASTDKSKDTSKDKVKEKEVEKVSDKEKEKDVEKEKDASQIAAEAVPVTDVSAISTDKIKDTSKDKVKEKEVEKANDKEKDASKVAAAAAAAAAAVPAIDESAVSTDKSKDTSKDKAKEEEVEKVKDKEKEKDVSKVATAAVPVTDVSAVSADKSKDTSKDKVKEKEVEKVKDKEKEKDASKVPAAAAVPAIDVSAASTDKSKDTGKDKVKEKEVEKVSDKEKEKDVSKVATAAAPVIDASAVSADKSKDTSKDKAKEEVEKLKDKEKEKDASKVPAAAAVPAIDASAVTTDKSKDTSEDKVKEKEVEKVKDKEKEKETVKGKGKGKEVEKVNDKEKEKDVSRVAAAAAPATDKSSVSSSANKALDLKDTKGNDDDDFLSSSDASAPKTAASVNSLPTPQQSTPAVKAVKSKVEDDYGDLFGDDEPAVKASKPASAAAVNSLSEKAAAAAEEDELFGDMTIKATKPAAATSSATVTSGVGQTQFSEEFDDLFGSDAASFTVVPQKLEGSSGDSTSVANAKQATKGAPARIAMSLSLPSTIASAAVGANKDAIDEDLDFLSWLGDATPERAATPTSVIEGTTDTHDSAANKSKNSKSKSSHVSEPSANSPTHAQSKVKAMMDVFFDDLFGGQQRPEEIAEQSTPTKARLTSADFEVRVRDMVSSSFVDVDSLRNLLLEGGYVPVQHRAQVWSVLLTGSCSSFDDAELRDTQNLSTLGSDLVNYGQLVSDCETIVKRDDASAGGLNLQNDLQDILILYCTRREREYNSVMCQMLLPLMLIPSSFTKESASSCFYSFSSEFTPLLSLDNSIQRTAIETVHSWVRLLVVYHSPAVAHHLDRVLPGWELAASLPTNKSESEMEMEAETGTEAETETETETQATEGSPDDESCVAVELEKIVDKESWGIPLQWVCAMFAGSIPAEHSCFLYDWALVSGQRYAGDYKLL